MILFGTLLVGQYVIVIVSCNNHYRLKKKKISNIANIDPKKFIRIKHEKVGYFIVVIVVVKS